MCSGKAWPRYVRLCVSAHVRSHKKCNNVAEMTNRRFLNSQILIHFNTGWTNISLELHLSLTLIPVTKKSTILSCGVIGVDVIIKRQFICLSVAANQDSQTWHYPFSDIVLNILYTCTQVHQTSNKQTNKTVGIIFKYSCDWVVLAQWNE